MGDMLKEVFKYADDDNSGGLTLKEFMQLSENMFDPIMSQIMKDVFDQADQDGFLVKKDGILTLEEFTDFNMKSGGKLDDAAFRKQASAWLELAKARVIV